MLLKKNKNSIVNGKKIGKLLDLIITSMEKVAAVTHGIISRPFCYLSFLDKKILDLEDMEVEVVYDIKRVLMGNKHYITDVDLSKNERYRRLDFDKFASLVHTKSNKNKDELISRPYVQSLISHI